MLRRYSMILLASPLALFVSISNAQPGVHSSPAAEDKVGVLEEPSFAAASVRPSSSKENGYRLRTTSGRLTAVGITAKELIEYAYDRKPFLIRGGLGWTNEDKFDITAAADESLALSESKEDFYERRDQIRLMTRHLLAERFGLVVHTQTVSGSVYELTLVKPMTATNHPGLRPFVEGASAQASTDTPGDYNVNMGGVLLSVLTSRISDYLRLPVIDKTSLSGAFDINLSWHDALNDEAFSANAAGSLPEALKTQLDLLLVRAKGPVEMLVIDKLDRPSAN